MAIERPAVRARRINWFHCFPGKEVRMALIRWEPVAELTTIQNEMNRLFNTLFDQPGQAPRGNGVPRRWVPAMDLVETDDHYVLRADLPGLSEDDVNIELESNVLTVSGERKIEHEQHVEGYYRVERAFGAFSRSLTLPEGVDAEAIQASFDRGVLEVRIPKPEERKPRKVAIKAGSELRTIAESTPAENGSSVSEPASMGG
jgi:HSP20 family protein